MKNIVLLNIILNLGLTIIFVLLDNNILKDGFEETLISLMLIYGITVVLINAIFIKIFCKK